MAQRSSEISNSSTRVITTLLHHLLIWQRVLCLTLHEDDQEITRLLPFFYPFSQSTTPDPTSTAASLANYLKLEPIFAAAFAIYFSTLFFHIPTTHPVHTSHVLQTVHILIKNPSLPMIINS